MAAGDMQLGDKPHTLHHRENKSVSVLLRENPYVAGVAMVRVAMDRQLTLI